MIVTLPTGNYRYRVDARRRKQLVVLQVEERSTGTAYSDDPYDIHGRRYDYTEWRDARPEDILKLSTVVPHP
jgi:hypothetical protein